jgi:hypothetical protein
MMLRVFMGIAGLSTVQDDINAWRQKNTADLVRRVLGRIVAKA